MAVRRQHPRAHICNFTQGYITYIHNTYIHRYSKNGDFYPKYTYFNIDFKKPQKIVIITLAPDTGNGLKLATSAVLILLGLVAQKFVRHAQSGVSFMKPFRPKLTGKTMWVKFKFPIMTF
jgi:hypothetical protein